MFCYSHILFRHLFLLRFPTSGRHWILIAFGVTMPSISYSLAFYISLSLSRNQVCDGMPPRKDFKSPKDFGGNNSSSSTTAKAMTIPPSAPSANLLTPDEKITLPMIDNDTQSTMKQVRTNQGITHRPAQIVLFGSMLRHTLLALNKNGMQGRLGCGNKYVLRRVLQVYLTRS